MSKKNYDNLMELLGDTEYRRIEVKGYMRLAVEWISDDLISLAHYGELNNDPMRDPEIVFRVSRTVIGNDSSSRTVCEAKPVYFRNDYVPIEHATVPGVFGDVPVKPGLQRDLDSFSAMWFRNLREQRFFERAKEHDCDHEIER